MKRIYLILSAFIFLVGICQAQQYFDNPVINQELADPSIIKIGETFFATGTSSEWAPHYPIYSSKDLINWKQIGNVFEKKPEWTSHSFWAPELFYHNNKIFCYYTARRKTDNISFIGVASTDSPYNEFTDHGPIIEYGTESIDAFVFDDNGQLYISWKAYGLDNRPIEILASKLSNDGLRLEGDIFSLLKDDERIGIEGQYHFKHNDYYYIIYAARGCCGPSSDYEVHVARSKDFKGPYVNYENNPVLHGGNGSFLSGGHGTMVVTEDQKNLFLFHAYKKGEEFYLGRRPVLQEISVTSDGWIEFTTGREIQIKQPTPFPNTTQEKWSEFHDDFKGSSLNKRWTWNYAFSDVNTKLRRGKLLLSGKQLSSNNYGSALCVRPRSADYSFATEIITKGGSFKGLTMYGDDKNLLAFGVQNNKVVLKSVKENKENILSEFSYTSKKLHLKIEVSDGCILRFYTSSNGKNWKLVDDIHFEADYLVRWDRVARPGLIHIGESDTFGEFSYFRMSKTR